MCLSKELSVKWWHSLTLSLLWGDNQAASMQSWRSAYQKIIEVNARLGSWHLTSTLIGSKMYFILFKKKQCNSYRYFHNKVKMSHWQSEHEEWRSSQGKVLKILNGWKDGLKNTYFLPIHTDIFVLYQKKSRNKNLWSHLCAAQRTDSN